MGCIDEVMSVGCDDLEKSVICPHAFWSCSGCIGLPSLKIFPSVRSQRSFAKRPPPTSNRPPFSSQLSCASHATSGETYSGFSASVMSFGRTVSVRREPAMGAMVFAKTFFFLPSSARVCAKPWSPSFAIA